MIECIRLTREEMAELNARAYLPKGRDAGESAGAELDYEPAEAAREAKRPRSRLLWAALILAAGLTLSLASIFLDAGLAGTSRAWWLVGVLVLLLGWNLAPPLLLRPLAMWLTLRQVWRNRAHLRRNDLRIGVDHAGVSLSLPGHRHLLPWHAVAPIDQTPLLWVASTSPPGEGLQPTVVPLPKRLLDADQVARLRRGGPRSTADVADAEDAGGAGLKFVPTAHEWRAALDVQAGLLETRASLRRIGRLHGAILAFLLIPAAVSVAAGIALLRATGEPVWVAALFLPASCILVAGQVHRAIRADDPRPPAHAARLAAAEVPVTLWRDGNRLVSAGTWGVTTIATDLVRARDADDVLVLTLPDESVLPLPRRAADAATLDDLLTGTRRG